MQNLTITQIGTAIVLVPENGAKIKTRSHEATVHYLNRHTDTYKIIGGLELLPELWQKQLTSNRIEEIHEAHAAQLLINKTN